MRKPVYLVMYYNYADTDYLGVFSTEQRAEDAITDSIKASPYRKKEDFEIILEKVQ